MTTNMTRAILLLALTLQGCVAYTVVDTAVSVTATVVETTVDVGAAVVTAPVRAFSSDDDDDSDDEAPSDD
ncbi:MAG: hypothetical protein AAFP17_01520 [Pseudomonadota bacterium]